MPEVLIASDAPWVRAAVREALPMPDLVVREVSTGVEALAAAVERLPDLAVLDLQMGNMGAFAVCLELRLEESGGRLGHVPVLMLVDRRADVFLARRSEAEGWLVKPLDPIRVRRAVTALLDGGTYRDDSYRPETVPARAGPPSG